MADSPSAPAGIEKGTSPGVPGGARVLRPDETLESPLRPDEAMLFQNLLGPAPAGGAARRPAPLVLVADDDPRFREGALEALSELKTAGLGVGDGAQALKLVMKENPDLVLLDLKMPGIDGYQVLRGIRNYLKFNGTLILVTGALGTPQEQISALALGADDYAAKPVQRALLKAKIKAMLRRLRP